MILAQSQAELSGPRFEHAAPDKRRHQRVSVALLGRYMLADRREFPCQTVDMSPGGVRITCAVGGKIGERIVLYLEQIGRLEGVIVRHPTSNSLAARLNATPRKRDKIASQLTWLANRDSLGLPEGRTHERLTPINAGVAVKIEGGREIPARLIDVSMSGAALATTLELPIGSNVVIGTTPGKVVRHFEGGIGVQFMLPISPDRFHEGMRL